MTGAPQQPGPTPADPDAYPITEPGISPYGAIIDSGDDVRCHGCAQLCEAILCGACRRIGLW